jgi:hypothetical protein
MSLQASDLTLQIPEQGYGKKCVYCERRRREIGKYMDRGREFKGGEDIWNLFWDYLYVLWKFCYS